MHEKLKIDLIRHCQDPAEITNKKRELLFTEDILQTQMTNEQEQSLLKVLSD